LKRLITVNERRKIKMRFEEKKDHYLDTKTGIKWSKQNFGSMLWEDAITKLPENWRLPTIEELLSIIDYSKHGPATELPDIVPSGYWSSTTYASNTGYAWLVNFNYGRNYDYYKSNSYYVRAVLERRK